jgi:hypothetical protein
MVTYRAAQNADTPLARWRFEQTSGTTFSEDISAVTATATGTVTPGVADPGGNGGTRLGADFAGGYATISGVSAWVPQTIEALVWLDTVPSTGSTTRPTIFGHTWVGNSDQMPLILGFNIDGIHQGRLGVGWFASTGGVIRSVNMTTALSTGVLHHIVGVRTGTTTLDIYVDGTNVATGSVTAYVSGTARSTANIGASYNASDKIDGRIFDLALYSGALTSTRVTAHYAAIPNFADLLIRAGGAWNVTSSGAYPPHAAGEPFAITGGGAWKAASSQYLGITTDGIPYTGYGDVQSQPAAPGGSGAAWWKYTPTASGSLAVDTAGTGWDTVLTVYASDRTTVLATNDTGSGLTGGESATSLAVTSGATYYVAVTQGSGATGTDGRYLLNATGPASADATPVEFPAPAPPSIPSADSPPSGVVVSPIQRVSEVYSAPTLAAGRPVQPWLPSSTTRADWGQFQVVMNGTDITYFRGFPVVIDYFELHEPFGCGPAQITIPGITPHDPVGTGDTAFLIGGYSVAICKAGSSVPLWAGFIGTQAGTYSADGAGYTVTCVGEIWMADTVGHQPRTYLPPVDLGSMVAVVFNLTPHRRILGMAQTITGIKTQQRGSSDTSVMGYAQELLASATTDDGSNQWTVKRTGTARQYAVALKDRTTVSWTIQTGQRGIEIQMSLDSTSAPNRIYGRGVAPNGYAWAGWVYPATGAGAAPAYPNASPSTTLTVGSTDAGTTSGKGVTDWQTKMAGLGYKVAVTGTYTTADATAARAVQTAKGLTVDGVTGPQTWAATFDVGANGADLTAAYRAPLSAHPGATPLLTNADGSFGGANPADNPNLIIVDRDEDFGDGITKAQATRSAVAEIARSSTPGWVGEIVFRADPQEGSKWDIREGQNVLVKGWTTGDILVHIAGVRASPPKGTDPGSVTLTVDAHARDLMTLGAVLRRDRDAIVRNPAMLPARKQRRSQLRADSVVEFDGESTGGVIPKHALFGGLWTVLRIPVSTAGKVAQVIMQTTGPAAPFVLAFFGDVVTPADLVKLVGASPLVERTDHMGPFDHSADALATRGFIEAIGGPGQACGYYPGYQTSPVDRGTTTLTGKLVSTGSWTYQSVRPPWLWLAEFSPTSCFISGRIFPAPVDT